MRHAILRTAAKAHWRHHCTRTRWPANDNTSLLSDLSETNGCGRAVWQ